MYADFEVWLVSFVERVVPGHPLLGQQPQELDAIDQADKMLRKERCKGTPKHTACDQ